MDDSTITALQGIAHSLDIIERLDALKKDAEQRIGGYVVSREFWVDEYVDRQRQFIVNLDNAINAINLELEKEKSAR